MKDVSTLWVVLGGGGGGVGGAPRRRRKKSSIYNYLARPILKRIWRSRLHPRTKKEGEKKTLGAREEGEGGLAISRRKVILSRGRNLRERGGKGGG